MAAGRLENKSATVQKYALNLFIMMFKHNPLGPNLRTASFGATLEQNKKILSSIRECFRWVSIR